MRYLFRVAELALLLFLIPLSFRSSHSVVCKFFCTFIVDTAVYSSFVVFRAWRPGRVTRDGWLLSPWPERAVTIKRGIL